MEKLQLPDEVREQLEDMPSKSGMINVWTCSKCNNAMICVHADTGVTPFMIACDKCGDTAQSHFYRVKQPTHVWFRPDTVEELMTISKDELARCSEETKKNVTVENVFDENLKHYNQGGLFRKPL